MATSQNSAVSFKDERFERFLNAMFSYCPNQKEHHRQMLKVAYNEGAITGALAIGKKPKESNERLQDYHPR